MTDKVKCILLVTCSFCVVLYFNYIVSENYYKRVQFQKFHLHQSEKINISNVIAKLSIIKIFNNDNHTIYSPSSTLKSNQLGLLRSIPDTRHKECKVKSYNLPHKNVSIIITFHNELPSILSRTLVSILNKTPRKFLHEIILVDDFSENFHVWQQQTFTMLLPSVLKFIRNSKRKGLIESRNTAAKLATGDFLVFLDSHCEVNTEWLEPLLQKLNSYYGIAVSPVLDSINVENFEYTASYPYLKGGFNWSLDFTWIPMSLEEIESRRDPSESFSTPTFAGGSFAISRKWFFELNGFNPLLKIWGGESLEMSFKVWLCGGQIEIVPCSRIGHIFRDNSQIKYNNTYFNNLKIIAESWLDVYKQKFYYLQKYQIKQSKEMTSVNSIKYLREKLQCKSFSWYLENVFTELGFSDKNLKAFGKLSCGKKCLNIIQYKKVNILLLDDCSLEDVTEWIFIAKNGELRTNSGFCLNVVGTNIKIHLNHTKCTAWTRRYGKVIHNDTELCISSESQLKPTLSPCKKGDLFQICKFSVESD